MIGDCRGVSDKEELIKLREKGIMTGNSQRSFLWIETRWDLFRPWQENNKSHVRMDTKKPSTLVCLSFQVPGV